MKKIALIHNVKKKQHRLRRRSIATQPDFPAVYDISHLLFTLIRSIVTRCDCW